MRLRRTGPCCWLGQTHARNVDANGLDPAPGIAARFVLERAAEAVDPGERLGRGDVRGEEQSAPVLASERARDGIPPFPDHDPVDDRAALDDAPEARTEPAPE